MDSISFTFILSDHPFLGSPLFGVKVNYFMPQWNGEWFLLCDGDCATGKSLFPPAYFSGLTETGTRLYSGEAEFNGVSVVFYLERGLNNGVVRQWAVPYEVGSDGEVILSRDQLPLTAGDKLAFWYQVYDTEQKQVRWKKGETLTFKAAPVWSFARIDAPRVYYAQAQDYKGNLATTSLFEPK